MPACAICGNQNNPGAEVLHILRQASGRHCAAAGGSCRTNLSLLRNFGPGKCQVLHPMREASVTGRPAPTRCSPTTATDGAAARASGSGCIRPASASTVGGARCATIWAFSSGNVCFVTCLDTCQGSVRRARRNAAGAQSTCIHGSSRPRIWVAEIGGRQDRGRSHSACGAGCERLLRLFVLEENPPTATAGKRGAGAHAANCQSCSTCRLAVCSNFSGRSSAGSDRTRSGCGQPGKHSCQAPQLTGHQCPESATSGADVRACG